MNAASLQIEGLLVAIAAIARAVADGDPARQHLLDDALANAARAVLDDSRQNSRLSASQVDAVAFPIRYLAIAARADAAALSFAQVTAMVGRSKPDREA